MTETEIRKDLEARASVLLWMQAHNIGSIDDVGKIMNLYYSEPQKLIQAAKSNSDPKTIIGEAK
jgi:hypothetical protein